MKRLFLILLLVGCGGGVKERLSKSASEIKVDASSIKSSALSSSTIARKVSLEYPPTKPDMDMILELNEEIVRRSERILAEANKIDENIEDIEEMIDWFKMIFLLGVGFGGIAIGYMGFKVGKWKTSVFGGFMCLSAVSMNFYWHLIETAFLPVVGGLFAIVLCLFYVHYFDERRKKAID